MNRSAFALAVASLVVTAATPGAAQSPAPPTAPARKPAVAPLPYLIKTAASLAELEKTLLGPGGHGSTLVAPSPQTALEVAWRHEENAEDSGLEVHDGRDHIFFVTEGRAVFRLGGELDAPKEVSPGEWRAPKAKGTRDVVAQKGDLIFIPHGTVHGRAKGGKFTMLLLSFWAGGAPAEAIAAAATPRK